MTRPQVPDIVAVDKRLRRVHAASVCAAPWRRMAEVVATAMLAATQGHVSVAVGDEGLRRGVLGVVGQRARSGGRTRALGHQSQREVVTRRRRAGRELVGGRHGGGDPALPRGRRARHM